MTIHGLFYILLERLSFVGGLPDLAAKRLLVLVLRVGEIDHNLRQPAGGLINAEYLVFVKTRCQYKFCARMFI